MVGFVDFFNKGVTNVIDFFSNLTKPQQTQQQPQQSQQQPQQSQSQQPQITTIQGMQKQTGFFPEPKTSAVPQASDVRVGTKTVNGVTYDVYTSPSGETFLGGVSNKTVNKVQVFDTGTYDPNTGVFTDTKGLTYSVADPVSFNNQLLAVERAKAEREKLESFSKTGGIKRVGSGAEDNKDKLVTVGEFSKIVEKMKEKKSKELEKKDFGFIEIPKKTFEDFYGDIGLAGLRSRSNEKALYKRSELEETYTKAREKGGLAYNAIETYASFVAGGLLLKGALKIPLVSKSVSTIGKIGGYISEKSGVNVALRVGEEITKKAVTSGASIVGKQVSEKTASSVAKELVKGGVNVGIGRGLVKVSEKIPEASRSLAEPKNVVLTESQKQKLAMKLQNVSFEALSEADSIQKASSFFVPEFVSLVSPEQSRARLKAIENFIDEEKIKYTGSKERAVKELFDYYNASLIGGVASIPFSEASSEFIGQTAFKGVSGGFKYAGRGVKKVPVVVLGGLATGFGGAFGEGEASMRAQQQAYTFSKASEKEIQQGRQAGFIFGGISGGIQSFGLMDKRAIADFPVLRKVTVEKATRIIPSIPDQPAELMGDVFSEGLFKITRTQQVVNFPRALVVSPSEGFLFGKSGKTNTVEKVNVVERTSDRVIINNVFSSRIPQDVKNNEFSVMQTHKSSLITTPSNIISKEEQKEKQREKQNEPENEQEIERAKENVTSRIGSIPINVNVVASDKFPFLPIVFPMKTGVGAKKTGRIHYYSELSKASVFFRNSFFPLKKGVLFNAKQKKIKRYKK